MYLCNIDSSNIRTENYKIILTKMLKDPLWVNYY